jgi:hypothetical protein
MADRGMKHDGWQKADLQQRRSPESDFGLDVREALLEAGDYDGNGDCKHRWAAGNEAVQRGCRTGYGPESFSDPLQQHNCGLANDDPADNG